jgi:hypothetical protein
VKRSNLAFSMKLPRLRAVTHTGTKRFGEGRDFGVQARTFQVLGTMS